MATRLEGRPAQRTPWRAAEFVALTYFVYTAILASLHFRASTRTALAWMFPIILWALVRIESRNSRPWSRIVRDWAPLALILPGYWEMNWFRSESLVAWEHAWVGWDRVILEGWKLRSLLEVLGPPIPAMLEAAYLFLYTLPLLGIAALYISGRRDRVDRFLTTLLLGVFTSYALLPYFPSGSPRLAFPGTDLPTFGGIFRTANLWLLSRFDITTSVFPSGHVSVAFSVAFGSLRALPERRRLIWGFFGVAMAVYVATIYGRYHYAVDGLASMGIACLAWWVSPLVEQHV